MKKFLSLLLAVIITATAFTALPFTVSAAEADSAEIGASSGKTGDCTWTLDDEGTLTISGNGLMGNYSYNNSTYTSDSPWGTGIKKVIIENGVTNIGNYAFYSCQKLNNITIPDSVTSIGTDAFIDTAWYNNQPDGVFYAGSIAYTYKGTMPENTSIAIKDGTRVIACSAFSRCKNLTSITIPDSVTSIGDYAFYYCSSLTSITLPDSVASIGLCAFSYCTSLTNITISDNITSISGRAFDSCKSLTSVIIPYGVTSIGREAFYGCTNLTRVMIPDSVTQINMWAFHGCPSLSSITIPESVTSIGDRAIGYDNNNNKIVGFTIYGYAGSTAEQYANENGFIFYDINSNENQNITDETTGVSVSVNEYAELNVTEIIDEELISDIKLNNGEKAEQVFDITLTRAGVDIQPNAPATVKIPCSDANAKVYRLETDGALTDMNARYEDGYKVFETEHFSIYILSVKGESDEKLGDSNGDGNVDVLDAAAIQKYAAGKADMTNDRQYYADVNGDNNVDILDATEIQKFAAGKITEFKKKT